ncbi:MAG: sulfotransferase [Anaerolineales bacterium]|nr:sulfotransferase [Anaerolineales bacterium]
MLNKIADRLRLASAVLATGALPPEKTQRPPIPAITPEEVAEAKSFFAMEKFFIFGHARSGTTLLMSLINLHPHVLCNRQAHFFSRRPLLKATVSDLEVASWLARPSNRWNRGKDLSPAVMRAMADFILERDARKAGKHIVGDKSPNNTMHGEAVSNMAQIYPDARLIFIVRDGRDALISHRFQTFIDGVQHLGKEDLKVRAAVIADPEPYLNGQKSIFTEHSIRESAHAWVRNVSETHQKAQELFKDQYAALRFEDMLDDTVGQIIRLWKFLGADITLPGLEEIIRAEISVNADAQWQQTKAGDIAQLLPKGGRGYWRQILTSRDKQIVNEIEGETLAAWNYERYTP